jgi:large subunit ribosomal protein L18
VENGRLRLNIFRSNNHIYGQVINDVEHHTLAAASTKSLKMDKGGDIDSAKAAGKALGDMCKSKGIEKLFFDRQSAAHKYTYHGRIQAFVEGMREGGVDL